MVGTPAIILCRWAWRESGGKQVLGVVGQRLAWPAQGEPPRHWSGAWGLFWPLGVGSKILVLILFEVVTVALAILAHEPVA